MENAEVKYDIDELLARGRAIWGNDKLTLPKIVIRLGVGVGDLCRMARGADKDAFLRYDLEKELGNLIFSVIRWCDDLGLDPKECVARAISAQEEFVRKNVRR